MDDMEYEAVTSVDDMARKTNDPFCGHLRLDGVIETLDGSMAHAPT